MAKVKNTGHQPRGFIQADGSTVTIPPGGEADVNMTEADHKYLTKMLADHDDPKPYEISGGHEAEAKKKDKKDGDDDAHNPAQSTEPPAAPTTTPVATPAPTQQAEKPKQQQAAATHKEK